MITLPDNFYADRQQATKQAGLIESRNKHLYCNVYPSEASGGYLLDVLSRETGDIVSWEFGGKSEKWGVFYLKYKFSGGTGIAEVGGYTLDGAKKSFSKNPIYASAELLG